MRSFDSFPPATRDPHVSCKDSVEIQQNLPIEKESMSDLTISYHGRFVKEKDSGAGTIMIRDGRIYTRDHPKEHWEKVLTPSTFYFYDDDSEVTFGVDLQRKEIIEIWPSGRVLDCTDRIIYDIQNGTWCPIYDLSSRETKTILKCTHLSPCEGFEKEPCRVDQVRIMTIELSKKKKRDFTLHFEVLGTNPVISEFSEICSKEVNFKCGTLDPEAVPAGGCAVLIYKTCLCDEEVVVIHIFIRDQEEPAFSARCGQILFPILVPGAAPINQFPGITPPLFPCPEELSAAICIPAIVSAGGLSTNLFPVQGWTEIYDVPEDSFDPVTGCWTAPRTGRYDIHAVLSYCIGALPFQAPFEEPGPGFVLVSFCRGINPRVPNPAAPAGQIEAFAAVTEVCIPSDVPPGSVGVFACSGQSIINVGLCLEEGETLCIFFLNNPAIPILSTVPAPGGLPRPGLVLVRNGTTFHAHFAGCTTEECGLCSPSLHGSHH